MITIGCLWNNEDLLNECLLNSPELKPNGPLARSDINVVLINGAESAAQGYNAILDEAKTDIVILVHQDMYLPDGWVKRVEQYAAGMLAPWAVIGIAGIDHRRVIVANVIDRGRIIKRNIIPNSGVKVAALDEVVLIVNRNTGIRFDENLKGFSLYGTDICMTAKFMGLDCFVVDALAYHNSLRPQKDMSVYEDPDYAYNARYLHTKYPRMPLVSTSMPAGGWTDTDTLCSGYKTTDMHEQYVRITEYYMSQYRMKFKHDPRVLKTDSWNEARTQYPILPVCGSNVNCVEIDDRILFDAILKCPQHNIQPGDIRRLPFNDASFDLILDFSTIDHVKDYGIALKEYHRVLAPGGALVQVVWTTVAMPYEEDVDWYKQYYFHYTSYKRELHNKGLKLVDSEWLVHSKWNRLMKFVCVKGA